MLLASGCATLMPRAYVHQINYEPYGEAVDARAKAQEFKKTLASTLEPVELEEAAGLAKSVRILERSLPPGVSLEKGLITTTPESHLQVLGTASFSFTTSNFLPILSLLWFRDYSSAGRKALCYPQVPLNWVTLGIWGSLIPTSIPCAVGMGFPIDEAYGVIRAAAVAAGATMVLIAGRQADDDKLYAVQAFFLKELAAEGGAPAAGATAVEVESVTDGYPYRGLPGNTCSRGKTFVFAKLVTALDGLSAGTRVVLRLESPVLQTAKAGSTVRLLGLQRAGTGEDGTPVFCGPGVPLLDKDLTVQQQTVPLDVSPDPAS
ncbi:MAG: hypothetical protein Q8S33_01900 [Myxococcales bacterium]|nr:hypothetical protein [Myxococcales bacterium]